MPDGNALNIPLETRLDLAFNAAGEIEVLLPVVKGAISEPRNFESAPALVAYRRIVDVVSALVDIAQPDEDDHHDFKEFRGRLTFGGNVPPPSEAVELEPTKPWGKVNQRQAIDLTARLANSIERNGMLVAHCAKLFKAGETLDLQLLLDSAAVNAELHNREVLSILNALGLRDEDDGPAEEAA